jgi:hypothetical protein
MSKWTKQKIVLPKTLKPKERVKIAEVVIEHIINRSAAGYDKNNDKFKPYSEKYAEKKGVGINDVDLILTGEMLDSITLLNHKAGEITIGYDDPDDELAGKVEGNRRGSYGGEPSSKKARDFLGISTDDLDVLISAYENDFNVQQTEQDVGGFDVGSILDQLLIDEIKNET